MSSKDTGMRLEDLTGTVMLG